MIAMDYVVVDKIYRQRVLTRNDSSYPGIAQVPDDSLSVTNFDISVNGANFTGNYTITPEDEEGSHLLTVDANGLTAGAYIEIFGEYEVQAIRYTFRRQVIVISDSAGIVAAINADATQTAARMAAELAKNQTTLNALKAGARAALNGQLSQTVVTDTQDNLVTNQSYSDG